LAQNIVQATVSVSYAILAEAGLSFPGLGEQASTPTWGLILADSRSFISPAWRPSSAQGRCAYRRMGPPPWAAAGIV